MVYNINYLSPNDKSTHCMFDIEFYLSKPNELLDLWQTELHSLPIVKGIVKFINENRENIDVDEFIKDATEIQELRGWLYEKHGNKLQKYSDAKIRHYNVFLKEFDEIIKKFVNKYGLDLNID